MTRRLSQRRAAVALVALGLGASMVSSSAATLGGLSAASLGAASAQVASDTPVTLDWNVDVEPDTFLELHNVEIDPVDADWRSGERIEVTAVGPSQSCTASATATTTADPLLVTFDDDCALELTDIRNVHAVAVSDGRAIQLGSNLGDVFGTIAAFTGDVVDPDAAAGNYTLVTAEASQRLASVSVTVDEAPSSGARIYLALDMKSADDIRLVVEAGDKAVSVTDGVRFTIDLSAVLEELPRASRVAGYSLAVLQPHLLQPSAPPSMHAVSTAGASLDITEPEPTPTPTPSPSPTPNPAGSAFDPVEITEGLVSRWTYTPHGKGEPNTLCAVFDVRNTTASPLTWQVVFDVKRPPLWGLGPQSVSLTSAVTNSFDASSGRWAVGGVDWNATLRPGQETTFQYCTNSAATPPLDATLYDPPQVEVDGLNTNRYSAALTITITSSSPWPVPWEATVDLAEHVCRDSIPDQVSAENALLEKLGPTTYRVRGSGWTERVSIGVSHSFVFVRFSPVADPLRPGC